MVYATVGIMFFSFVVWLHHFFTMGAGANVNAFFGIMTMIIAIPTGVKIFNWLFTMYGGRIVFKTPMLWFFGFVATFTLGGMTGVLLAMPAIDFQVHNSLFLVAHFHNTIIGGVVFGYFAGLTYWFPKMFGFTLNEKWGTCAFWAWIIGFFVAFMPLYALGFMGATRRLVHYTDPSWQPYFIVAGIGVVIVVLGVVFQLIQLAVSIRDRKKNRDVTGDPWFGRTLEWSIPSPAPIYNFAVIPHVYGRDPLWAQKHGGEPVHPPEYVDIHLSHNSGIGVTIAIASVAIGFGLVWHMWWLALIALVGIVVSLIMRAYDENKEYVLSAHEVKQIEMRHMRA